MSDLSGRRIRVALVAGEASGDLLGAHLLAALKERIPRLEAFGIGGPRMQSTGMQSWYPMEWFAVRGYVEVIRSLPKLLRVRRELKRRLLADPPDLFIGIDAPAEHGIGIISVMFTVPVSRPIAVVASFHVDPGGYVPCSALL